ncbi:MAG TPA: DUF4920 domain-containing protein [Flavisolibacter sp.]|jgi:hypothetical protein|nr:DUF4920 domain-containing protein [Flavisolibacter sp.]
MKRIIFLAVLGFTLSAGAQKKEKVPAAKDVVYGQVSEEKSSVGVDDLINKLVDNAFAGQIKGKVAEVCKAEGCWIRLQKADGTTMMVRAKDHSFLMPENIVGKTVLVEGSATVKETSEEMRKHYAEDAGKSKEEIAKIKGSQKSVEFAANGVKVLD